MKELRVLVCLSVILVAFCTSSSVSSFHQQVDCQFDIRLLELSNETSSLLLQRSDLIGCQKEDKCTSIFIKVNLQCQSGKVVVLFILLDLFFWPTLREVNFSGRKFGGILFRSFYSQPQIQIFSLFFIYLC